MEIGEQLKEDLTFLPKAHFVNYKRVFDEVLLSWYLGNIAGIVRKTVQ